VPESHISEAVHLIKVFKYKANNKLKLHRSYKQLLVRETHFTLELNIPMLEIICRLYRAQSEVLFSMYLQEILLTLILTNTC